MFINNVAKPTNCENNAGIFCIKTICGTRFRLRMVASVLHLRQAGRKFQNHSMYRWFFPRLATCRRGACFSCSSSLEILTRVWCLLLRHLSSQLARRAIGHPLVLQLNTWSLCILKHFTLCAVSKLDSAAGTNHNLRDMKARSEHGLLPSKFSLAIPPFGSRLDDDIIHVAFSASNDLRNGIS